MLQDLVIQPTTYCNISCSYCYLPHRDLKRQMSLTTLRATLNDVFNYPHLGEYLNVIWHAGEPLTLGINYFKHAFGEVAAANTRGLQIRHRIQTNGVLLNDEWCDLITDHDVCVGLSVDGPAFIHDARRVARSGTGTHIFASRALRLLRGRNVNYRVICVLSKTSVEHPEELIDFFIDHEVVNLGFNLETVQGQNESSSLSDLDTEILQDFWIRILRRIAERQSNITIREIEWAISFISSGTKNDVRRLDNTPLAMLTVDVDGAYHTFSPELAGLTDATGRSYAFGMAGTGGIVAAARSEAYSRLVSDVEAGTDICRHTCRYFSVCGGGAPSNKLAENGSIASGETSGCRMSIKVFFDMLSTLLPEVACFLESRGVSRET
jgi:uncharacterized protein